MTERLSLADRLMIELHPHLPDMPQKGWAIRRTYAGAVQRSHGAFSFFLSWASEIIPEEAIGFNNYVGSQWGVTALLKLGIDGVSLRNGDLHINPKALGHD